MEKIDIKKRDKALYRPSAKHCDWVDVPELSFLMVDGQGNPLSSDAYAQAVEALYAVSYTVKFMIKKQTENPIDYGVLPLEGLWWAEDMSAFTDERRDEWLWTMMIRQPEFVSETDLHEAIDTVRQKKNPPAIDLVRLERFREGRAAQIMHIGPFSEEGPTIEKLHGFIEGAGEALGGKHHEIYLSDIRRAAPEKWKTVIRQPVR